MQTEVALLSNQWVTEGPVSFCGDLFYRNNVTDPFELFSEVNDLKEFSNILADVAGHFGVIIEHEDAILAATDHIRNVPLFYSTVDGVVVSDRFSWIRDRVPSQPVSTPVAIELLQSRMLSGQATLHPDINKIQTAGAISLSKSTGELESTRYHKYCLSDNLDYDKTKEYYLDKLVSALDGAFSRLRRSVADSPVILALSAGVDSRLLAYWLRRHEFENVFTFTYDIGTNENDMARTVASELGFEWTCIDITRERLETYLRSETASQMEEQFGGYGTKIPTPRTVLTLQELNENTNFPDEGMVLYGFQMFVALDKFPRMFFRKRSVEKNEHIRSLIDWKYSYIPVGDNIRSVLTDRLLQLDIYQDAESEFDRLAAAELLDQFYLYENHSSKGPGNRLLFNNFGYDLWYPFYDAEVIDFVSTIPIELRFRKSLLRELVEQLDKEYLTDTPPGYTKPTKRRIPEDLIIGTILERPARRVNELVGGKPNRPSMKEVCDVTFDDSTPVLDNVPKLSQSQLFKSYQALDQLSKYPDSVKGLLSQYYGEETLKLLESNSND